MKKGVMTGLFVIVAAVIVVGLWHNMTGHSVSPTVCVENDGGINYEKSGTVRQYGKDNKDYCITGRSASMLAEWYCDASGEATMEEKDCLDFGANYICRDGMCRETCVCEDTDGGNNIYEKGVVTGRSISGANMGGEEKCTSAGSVAEWTCAESPADATCIVPMMINVGCPDGYSCVDGACVQ